MDEDVIGKTDTLPSRPSVLPAIMSDLMLQRSCVAYVGAGFSMACGMPNWTGLMKQMIEYGAQWLPKDSTSHAREAISLGDLSTAAALLNPTKAPFQINDCLNPPGCKGLIEGMIDLLPKDALTHAREAMALGDLPMAAALLRAAMPPVQINDCLNYTFGPAALARATASQRDRMKKRMDNLANSGWAGIVTTNYDFLIEQAIWKRADGADWRSDIQIDGDPTRLCEVLIRAREDRQFYVKLHGSVSGSGVVFSTEEYDQAYLRSPQVSTFLQALMLQYHLIFIGCSLEDEVVRIRRKLTADFRGLIPRAYAIMPKTTKNEARFRFLATSASIDPIWYSGEDHEHQGLDDVLEEFSQLPAPPEDSRIVLRYRNLSDRFKNISPTNQQLLAYIANQDGRSVDFNYLTQEIAENDLLKTLFSHSNIEDELKYRLFYLTAIGLLWEVRSHNKDKSEPMRFLIPRELTDELLRK